MVMDSSRLGNAPETLSKTGGERLARERIAVRHERGANVGQRSEADGADHVIVVGVDDRHAPLSAVVRAFALGQWTRIVGGLQREELRDEDPLAVGGDRDPVRLCADALDGVGHLVASRVDHRHGVRRLVGDVQIAAVRRERAAERFGAHLDGVDDLLLNVLITDTVPLAMLVT